MLIGPIDLNFKTFCQYLSEGGKIIECAVCNHLIADRFCFLESNNLITVDKILINIRLYKK